MEQIEVNYLAPESALKVIDNPEITTKVTLTPLAVVDRQFDRVIVAILRDKTTGKYRFANLTKGHICECQFNSYEDAIEDLNQYMKDGRIENWRFML